MNHYSSLRAKRSNLIRLLILLICFGVSVPVQAFNLAKFLRFDRMKKEFDSPYKSESLKPGHQRLTVALVSDANLYPALINSYTSFNQQQYTVKPPVNSIVLYEETQVLLQETIRELIQLTGESGLDLVIFGGSQVYSNEHYDLFQDISSDLNKFSISHYSMVGANELNGPKPLSDCIRNRYYLLKLKNTNIIVLDNISEAVVPQYLPEEATEQYIWFKKTLAELQRSESDTYIFTYKPLETKTKELINKYPELNLVLVAHSSFYEFSNYQADDNFGLVQKPRVLSNSSIAAYPLAYSLIERDTNGQLKIKNKEIALEGLRKLAKKRWN